MSRNKPTFVYAIASMAMVLFLVGLFALMVLQGNNLVALFKEKVDVWLEFRQDTPEEEITRIVQEVRQQPFVITETVTFVSSQQAAAAMREELGNESLLADIPNLMRDVVRFNVRSDFFREDSLRQWREILKQDSLVAELYVEAANTGNIGRNIENIGWLTLGLSFLLIFAAVTLIHNTIRLSLFANRFIIKNQELVGASWGFITRPYIRQGILNGLWSALLAIGVLIGLLNWTQNRMPEIKELQDLNGILAVFVGLVALGITLSGLSTWFVVNKFLRMRIDDLY
ncbi:MAG: cell division protein FtsX [Saprospiraceae bacterium]